MRFWSITGPDGLDYPLIRAPSPYDAFYRLHRSALGRQVRRRGGRLVFLDPRMQAVCCGVWKVIPAATNGTRRRLATKIAICWPGCAADVCQVRVRKDGEVELPLWWPQGQGSSRLIIGNRESCGSRRWIGHHPASGSRRHGGHREASGSRKRIGHHPVFGSRVR